MNRDEVVEKVTRVFRAYESHRLLPVLKSDVIDLIIGEGQKMFERGRSDRDQAEGKKTRRIAQRSK